MRVLQLIDSLHPGGAERMAVTLANALCSSIEVSALAVTRSEGLLKSDLKQEVNYVFLERTKTIDFKALYKLKTFVKNQKIDIVHAHTTSYFFAAMLKLIAPKITVFWHEHQGNRVLTSKKDNKALVYCSKFFKKIITVNQDLKAWCEENLRAKEVHYFSNFVDIAGFKRLEASRQQVIVCLANLLQPKNHLNLLRAFAGVHLEFPEWQLQLIGRDFEDSYSDSLKSFVSEHSLDNKVDFLGSIGNSADYLATASIGVLSSDSEGLPMALLEYGASGLAVVATKVGFCEEVMSTFGIAVPPNDSSALASALKRYVGETEKRHYDAANFKEHIERNYSVTSMLPKLISLYKN